MSISEPSVNILVLRYMTPTRNERSDCVRDKRIKAELARLKKLFSGISEQKRQLVDGLIHRAAYMRATLEDYEADLDADGYVESFTQSEKTEPYERERPVARLYNTGVKNYSSIIKQLCDLLPEDIKSSVKDEIKEYM